MVARFLQTLRLEPIILHEQANAGRTIIEKFEDHADVTFAVVLLTPDDEGGLMEEKHEFKLPATDADSLFVPNSQSWQRSIFRS